jgi:hypothetical protein
MVNFDFLGDLLKGGPGLVVVNLIALVLMALAIAIWVMELSGYTITRKGFKKNGLKWNSRTIALIAISGAIYIAGRPLQLQFIPGIGGFNPSFSLGPVFSVLFGLPGAIGVTFSMPIGDAISGALTLGSVAGFLGHTFYTWVPYKIVTNPRMNNLSAWGRLYVSLLVGGIMLLITICGWLAFTNVLPPAVAWGGVSLSIFINQLVLPAIVVPVLLVALFPLVRQWGLYHLDLSGTANRKGPSMRQASAAKAAADSSFAVAGVSPEVDNPTDARPKEAN